MLNLSKKYLNIQKNDLNKYDIINLQKLIKFHSDLYYNKDEPIISDSEYDNLFKKLEYLENKYKIKNKISENVWSELKESTFQKVKHSRPMISLDNTYDEEDLRDFDDRVIKNIWDTEVKDIEYILEFKFDWLGVELIYKKWKLIQAITRWNWIEWEDVTANVMQISNIPKKIDYFNDLEVRWEVVMPISVFEEINKNAKLNWEKVFSNPRNSASWSLRTKDVSITRDRKLQFFAYDLTNFEEFRLKENISEYFYVIKKLELLGFSISSYFKKLKWINEVINAINNFWKVKESIDFEIDWLVLKVNDISLWNTIWFTQHHPRYAISYKFPAEIFTTKILSVDHQVGRTWTITPVANLVPVNIWWAIIRRATLHNYEEVENLDVRIWDNVFIKRAWEVIPKIISVVKDTKRDNLEKILPPKYCPSCKTEVKKDKNKVRYYCSNNVDCPAKHHEKLSFAVGKWWFNIDWFWVKQVEFFLNEWIINNLVDVFKLEEKRTRLLELEWFKEKSVDNLINWIQKAKKVDISTFITALWIAWVWKKTAKTLSILFKNKQDLINFNKEIEEIESLDDIWPEIAKNIIEYLNVESHKQIIYELVDILDITYYSEKKIDKKSIFTWKKMCITWSFELNWKKISRDELIKKLENIWGKFVWTVSKNLDYLLAWEKAWSKLEKANKLWIEIIDLIYFLNNV